MLKTNIFLFVGNALFVLIIMLLELIFILVLFHILFKTNTLNNLPQILIISSIFILIWTILGFIISRNINSDEGAIFSGTILGLIVFFLSDVIVPMESFPKVILYIYKLNPFVYFSDIIRSNYLIQESLNMLGTNVLFLLFALILSIIIGIISVTRDMKNAS